MIVLALLWRAFVGPRWVCLRFAWATILCEMGGGHGDYPLRQCQGKPQELFPGRKLSRREDFGIDLGMLLGVRVHLLHSRIKIFSILVSCLVSGG